MPRRAQNALIGAAGAVIALLLVWFVAHRIPAGRALDANVLTGFESLRRPWLDRLSLAIASLCDVVPYVLFAVVPVAIALLRGRSVGWRLALAALVILVGANTTTSILKPLLVGAHDAVGPIQPSNISYPSGHATASMSLALTMVLVAPPRRRALTAAVMAGFTVAVCWSFLEQGWHYPSDVLGGFLVAGTWTLLAVAGLALLDARRPLRTLAGAGLRPSLLGAVGLPVLALGSAGVLAAGLALARPHAAVYLRAHELFALGATTIAVLAFGLAGALGLALRREPL